MLESLRSALLFALVLAAPVSAASAAERVVDRTLPMRFDLRQQGPAETCGAHCALWIAASGAITADSGRDFKQFLQIPAVQKALARNAAEQAATVVLESDGGSVLGAIALGREIRKAGLPTTVGHVIDLEDDGGVAAAPAAKTTDDRIARATLSPRADCESMCAFVVLGGVHRSVPRQARVMVHQIWLGDRRDDPTAATYSAEDLVLVQRDIGRLAQFTAEMGGSPELLDLALRIPPWEPLHAMTRAEIRDTQLATRDDDSASTTASVAPQTLPPPAQAATDGARTTPISERRWAVVERAGGSATLARRHPLTAEGDDIGSFDLVLACGAGPDSFDLSYIEHRHATGGTPLVARVADVSLRAGRSEVALKVASSARHDKSDELVSFATGVVPAAMLRAFADAGSHSMVVVTHGIDPHGTGDKPGLTTVIRLGNTGTQKNLPRLVASCATPLGDRAEAATSPGTGGSAGGILVAR
ncbi:MAG: hypothetical protein GC182_09245 [Rhodopseudomonas sp.]|nr:hypothetical protein [Rhodopseudomonas sp.]